MQRRYSGLFLLIFLMLVSCGGNTGGENKPKPGEGKKQGRGQMKHGPGRDTLIVRTPVEVMRIERGSISSSISHHSTLSTEEGVDVYPLVSGQVAEIQVEEGDHVEQGEELVTLADEPLIINRDKAQLLFDQRDNDWTNAQELLAINMIPLQEYRETEFAWRQARLDLDIAQLNLERSRIKSPIAGVVSDRYIRPGQLVNTGTMLFSLVDLSVPIIEIHLSQQYFNQVLTGQNVEITSELYDDVFTGQVKRINPVIDPASGTFKVTIGVSNPSEKLRPGMFVEARILLAEHIDVLLLPKNALIYERDQVHCFIVHDDTLALRRDLTTGFTSRDAVEVLSGLEDGEQIVLVGQSALKDSSRVRVINVRENTFTQNNSSMQAGS